MKVLKWLLVSLVGLIVLLGAIGFLLPKEAHVERSITINAPPGAIYPLVSDLRRFNEWSPWYGLDPDAQFTYDGNGEGASMTWSSEDRSVGTGRMTIRRLAADRVDMDLDFNEQGTATSYLTLDANGDTTVVTWGFDTVMDGLPFARYFGLMMDKWVGEAYEQGLADLKQLAEAGNGGETT